MNRAAAAASATATTAIRADDECPVCGLASLVERKCKVICRNCRTIVQSCADL
jgi:ribosomal protein S14